MTVPVHRSYRNIAHNRLLSATSRYTLLLSSPDAIMGMCLRRHKGGFCVNDRREVSYRRGGSQRTASLNRYRVQVAQYARTCRISTCQESMAHRTRRLGQVSSVSQKHETRKQLTTDMLILSAATRKPQTSFQPVSDSLLRVAAMCSFCHNLPRFATLRTGTHSSVQKEVNAMPRKILPKGRRWYVARPCCCECGRVATHEYDGGYFCGFHFAIARLLDYQYETWTREVRS